MTDRIFVNSLEEEVNLLRWWSFK